MRKDEDGLDERLKKEEEMCLRKIQQKDASGISMTARKSLKQEKNDKEIIKFS